MKLVGRWSAVLVSMSSHPGRTAWVRSLGTALAGCALLLGLETKADACGASGGGVAGVESCSLEEHEEAQRPKFRVGAMGTVTSTALRFSGDRRAEQSRYGALALFDHRPTKKLTLRFGAGSLVGGSLAIGGTSQRFEPGLILATAASYRIVEADGALPFVLLSAELAFTSSATRAAPTTPTVGYRAVDLRLGATAGYSIANTLTPYASARVFGGPIYWTLGADSLTGTDVYHYQVGLGASLTPLRRLDVFVEGMALGERAVSVGAGYSF